MKTMPHPDDLSVLLLGIATVGNLTFVPAEERAKRRQDLYDAGVLALVESWADVAAMVLEAAPVVAERRS
jgi:hypothetical protein